MNVTTATARRPLILIVDDNDEMRLQLRHFLQRDDYRFAEAADGVQALDQITMNPPDLVILDFVLPQMDGVTVCRKIRELPGGDGIPVLMVTAMDDASSIEQIFGAGADELISKPIHWSLIRHRVRALRHEKNRVRELERTTLALDKANRELHKMNELRSLFIATLGHELRTPLNPIIGFSNLLLDGKTGQISEEQHRQLEIISRCGKQMIALVNDLADIASIESGKFQSVPTEFGLRELVDDACESVALEVKEKGLELTRHLPDEPIVVFSDPKRLRQCLLNLLSNAVKYTPSGKIDISVSCASGSLTICVADSGVGISKEGQKRLFKPYSRLEAGRDGAARGTGLGLYLTRKLATEVLGGDVSVESLAGKGSRFCLSVPQRLSDDQRRDKGNG